MAFFKYRKGGEEPLASAGPSESIDAMRRRARHRLIGAALLVLVGVVGFPLVFDTQPRPIAVDIPIDIPDRNKARPLALPAVPPASAALPVARAPAVAGPVTPAASPASAAPPKTEAKAEVKPPPAPAPAVEAKPPSVAKAEVKPEPRADPKPVAKPEVRSDDGARARALLEGAAPDAAAGAASAAGPPRFVVQVGAFADPEKARETRLKVERAGLKTYTHVAETKDGKRTRVRVGPFASREEADKAAGVIKGLDLPAAILTL